MNAKLTGGAGPTLNSLVASWSQPAPTGISRNDYAAISQGQLKALAKKFYDRLAEVGYQGPPLAPGQIYPWSSAVSDDNNYAPANIGQVKFLFSFAPAATLDPGDTDADGLPDEWEQQYFGGTAQTASGDPDEDGVSNLIEFRLGRDPTKSAVPDSGGTMVQLRLFDFGP